jgi:hypothetical protein
MGKKRTDEEIIAALQNAKGNRTKAAQSLGIGRSTFVERLGRVDPDIWKAAAPIPPTHHSPRTTVLYDGDGNVLLEWRKLEETAKVMDGFVNSLCERVKGKGRAPVRKPRKTDSEDILFEIDVADPHIGMYACAEETRDRDYNCEIATRQVIDGVDALLMRHNRPDEIVLTFLGDTAHSDSRNNQTEKSKNILDVDTRYHRVADHLTKVATDAVDMCARAASRVRVVVVEGNHDWHSSVWLARVLSAFYRACPNVVVELSHSPRKHLVWGDTLLVWAHGDQVRMNRWNGVITTEFRKEWGSTRFHHLKLGHVHHQKKIPPMVINEDTGLLIEYLSPSCPSDAWHAGAGYIGSQRGLTAFEYHKKAGLLARYNHWT